MLGLVEDQIAYRMRAFSAEVKGTSLAVAEFGEALQKSGRDFGELASFVDALGRLHDDLKVKVLHVDQQVASLGGLGATTSLRTSTILRLASTIWNNGVKSSLRACEVQPPAQGGIQILGLAEEGLDVFVNMQRKFQHYIVEYSGRYLRFRSLTECWTSLLCH